MKKLLLALLLIPAVSVAQQYQQAPEYRAAQPPKESWLHFQRRQEDQESREKQEKFQEEQLELQRDTLREMKRHNRELEDAESDTPRINKIF